MVRDDEASRKVRLDPTSGALAGISSGAVAIESSTLTSAWIAELGEVTRNAGIALLEAPVSGSTPQAQSGELMFLIGGETETLKRAEALLRNLGSSIQHAGPLGAGALAKLVTNTLMAVQLSTLAQMIGMLRKHDVEPSKVLQAVAGTALWNAYLTRDSQAMLSQDFAPRFPVSLLEKDLRYTVKSAGGDEFAPTAMSATALLAPLQIERRDPTQALQFPLPDEGISLEAIERELISYALERFKNNQTQAARYLDISRRTLIYRIEKHGITEDEPKWTDTFRAVESSPGKRASRQQ